MKTNNPKKKILRNPCIYLCSYHARCHKTSPYVYRTHKYITCSSAHILVLRHYPPYNSYIGAKKPSRAPQGNRRSYSHFALLPEEMPDAGCLQIPPVASVTACTRRRALSALRIRYREFTVLCMNSANSRYMLCAYLPCWRFVIFDSSLADADLLECTHTLIFIPLATYLLYFLTSLRFLRGAMCIKKRWAGIMEVLRSTNSGVVVQCENKTCWIN